MQLIVRTDGTVDAIYDDKLAELFQGEPLAVRRASNVEFNGSTQMWEATLAIQVGKFEAGCVIAREATRASALAEEVKFLQTNM